MELDFSVVIPNWNGTAFLCRCLNAAIVSASSTGLKYELIVIDDASCDNSVELISKSFPNVRLYCNKRNLGFAASVNRGVALAQAPIIVLLNNDLSPRQAMIHELILPLQSDKTVFAVSAKTVDWYTGQPNHVNMFAKFCDGRFHLAYEDSSHLCESMFFQGGSCALRREAFLSFGGFCSLFYPGYWEDYDMSYLALKSGWRILYNPRALALHVGQGSMKRAYGAERIEAVKKRNRLIFQWLNFSDKDLIGAACHALPYALADSVRRNSHAEFRALSEAICCVPQILELRAVRKKWWKHTDKELFSHFANIGKLC